MENTRTERDMLGEVSIAADSLTGIHAYRAALNFGSAGGWIHFRLLQAYGQVKLACARTNAALGYLSEEKMRAIEQVCTELAEGKLWPDVPTSAMQGGAGTSTNMLVNELIANRALQIMGHEPGKYEIISPYDVNLHQSTNDTYPTTLRVAAMLACRQLENKVSHLAESFQRKEKEFADVVKLARTELQDAVLTTMGRQMGAYAEAFSKDRWRIYKCQERLRVINLGGTAIGTGIGAPQQYIFKVCDELRQITGLNLARAENLIQATQNCDEIVEVSGILKTLATNLFKISSDIRLMGSGPAGGLGELKLPPRQAGSSIMPGKVNPVIAEFVGNIALNAIARDTAITLGVANGQLELNTFYPLIAHNLLCMIDELMEACMKFSRHLIVGLEVDRQRCRERVESSTAVITAFVGRLGYERAAAIAEKATRENKTIRQVLIEERVCTEQEFEQMTSAEAVTSLGFKSTAGQKGT
jgi:aspartate ammonia-lyase